jgi:hypothetical protein
MSRKKKTLSDSAIVKHLVEEIRKTKHRGPRAMRMPGHYSPLPFGRGGVGGGHDSFSHHDALSVLVSADSEIGSDYRSWSRRGWRIEYNASKRLLKRAMKKSAQPHRRKDRGPMRAKASGKNNVTRRG